MFSSQKKKYTFFSIVATSLLFSLFQNCGSSAPKQYGDSPNAVDKMDTNGPQLSFLEKPASQTNSPTASFQLAVSDDRSGVDYIEYQHNNGEWKRIVNMLLLNDLESGDHQVKFKAVDKSKNESMILLHKWTIDATKPVVKITSAPNELSALRSFGANKLMVIKFTASDNAGISSIVCKINGKEKDCVNPKEFSATAAKGFHSASIVVTDTAKNTTTVTKYWTVGDEVGVLAPTFYKTPDSQSREDIVDIRFYGIPVSAMPAGSSYKCTINDQAVTPCNPNASNKYEGIMENKNSKGQLITNKFKVVLKHGSYAPVTSIYEWYTDTTPPTLTMVTKPAELSLTTNPEFRVNVADNSSAGNVSLVCQLDGAEFRGCLPNVDFNISVSANKHVLEVAAQDDAGNISTTILRHEWTAASCNTNGMAMRWPMTGPENSNWAVQNFVDNNANGGEVKDWGPREGSKARAADRDTETVIFPGDNKKVFGADLKSRPDSARVLAMESGKVVDIQQGKTDTSIAGVPNGCSGFNFVKILHDNGYISIYKHLAKGSVPANVIKGDRVSKGQIIGYAGSSGCLKKPQLTVQVEKCNRGNYADPMLMGMQVDTEAMAYAGDPLVYNMVVHNAALNPADDGHMKHIMNRTYENKSGTEATVNKNVTVSFHASKLTVGEHLRVSYALSTESNVNNYTYRDLAVSTNSEGRFMSDQFKPTVKGTWKVRVYHRNSDDCKSNTKSKWSKCVISTGTFVVK